MTKIRIALVALFASLAAFPASSREIKVGILTV